MKSILNSPGALFAISVLLALASFAIVYVKEFRDVSTLNTSSPSTLFNAFHSKQCVDGVQYLQFLNAVVVQVDLNGKPVACSK